MRMLVEIRGWGLWKVLTLLVTNKVEPQTEDRRTRPEFRGSFTPREGLESKLPSKTKL